MSPSLCTTNITRANISIKSFWSTTSSKNRSNGRTLKINNNIIQHIYEYTTLLISCCYKTEMDMRKKDLFYNRGSLKYIRIKTRHLLFENFFITSLIQWKNYLSLKLNEFLVVGEIFINFSFVILISYLIHEIN